MRPIKLSQLATWAEGSVEKPGHHRGDLIIRSISTDSRHLTPESCFVPLAGENFDGHDYIIDAVEKGAHAIVCERRRAHTILPEIERHKSVALIVVENPLMSLQKIAMHYRSSFDIPVIAVTGSNGKTTTKEMLKEIISTQYNVFATEGNLNNHIGVPLTLFQLDDGVEAMVVEMGMNAPGEIARLGQIAKPTMGVITNVGPVHLENFDGIQGIARAKEELVGSLPANGLVVLNEDDPLVSGMASSYKGRVIKFGLAESADVRAENVTYKGLEGTEFNIVFGEATFPVVLALPGNHQVYNAMAAAAVGLSMGIRPDQIQHALTHLEQTPMRMHVKRLKENVTVIDDAYNASPLSMKAALSTLGQSDGKRRIALLAGMLELGTSSTIQHRSVGYAAGEADVDVLAVVGDEGKWIAEGALAKAMDRINVIYYDTVEQAESFFPRQLEKGDVVLVKGSRGFRLERVVEAIEHYLDRSRQQNETERLK